MSDPTRPRGLRDPSARSLQELVRAGRQELPDDKRLRGIGASLGFGAPVAGIGAAAKGAATGAGFLSSTTAKIGTAVFVMLAAAGGVATAVRPTVAVGLRAPTPSTSMVVPVGVSPTVVSPASTATTVEQVSVAPEPTKPPPLPAAPVSSPERWKAPAATAAPPVDPAAPPAPPGVAAKTANPSTLAAADLQPASPAAPAEETEIDLLSEAQRALGADPGRALQITDRDARLHPSGTLAQEREMIAIQALVRLGQRNDASARADRFRASHPGSAYGPRIDALLGIDPGSHNP